jgi:hypothetical protein
MSITRRRHPHPFIARTLTAIATFATLAAAPALTACSDDSPAAPTEQVPVIAGTYALERVNGQALPFGEGNEYWDAMTLTLGSDRTVSGTLGWHETDDDGMTVDEGIDSFAGTYTVQGSRLTLTIEDDEPMSAVLDGDVLTVTDGDDVLVFRRR